MREKEKNRKEGKRWKEKGKVRKEMKEKNMRPLLFELQHPVSV